MPSDVLNALIVLFRYCLRQDSCEDCAIKECCNKMPCEYKFDI